jgi:hypothetical protein
MTEQGIIDPEQPYGPQILEWFIKPIIYENMPFGKHKGTKMKDVPHSYWQWAMKNTDWFDETSETFDPDLAASIEAALGLD